MVILSAIPVVLTSGFNYLTFTFLMLFVFSLVLGFLGVLRK